MRLEAEIISCSEDNYQGKRGLVNQQVLTLLDRGEQPRMKNTIDFVLTREQAERFPVHDGHLSGKPIVVAVTEIGAAFGGRNRVRGEVVKFEP
jgi:hypothetical protein